MNDSEKLMVEAYSKLPAFKKRISKALDVIELGFKKGNSYVAVSWGKDSVVLLHLVQSLQPDIKAIYHAHIERDLISNYSETIDRYLAKFPTNLTSQKLLNLPNPPTERLTSTLKIFLKPLDNLRET